MGTCFTTDTPLKVARYGISSVISLVDDVLIEQLRKLHCEAAGEVYEPIEARAEDSRAKRITAYLNLLDRLVQRQVEELRAAPFEPGSEITRYFEMLPDGEPRRSYEEMLAIPDPHRKTEAQERLRERIRPGSIDVNIMSKVDREPFRHGRKCSPELSDASSALRGYANSTLRSSIVLSAGFNRRLYAYLTKFSDFFPDAMGRLKKKVTLKVSDYRSAVIQGRFLTQRGIWVSEYRIESGLNCGGHAFATKGMLMGPILEEFKRNKAELAQRLHRTFSKALTALGIEPRKDPNELRVTVQGGVGTAAEYNFLRERYGVDSVGWGTPFLLVPEVTNVDDEHLKLLAKATRDDVHLSGSSPFGLPFWTLRESGSERIRRRRIAEGNPGSPCRKGYSKLYNTEFTDAPICVASRDYQRRKLAQLEADNLPPKQLAREREIVLSKACICDDLAGCATVKNDIEPDATPAICPGPGIEYFSRIATLREMIDHIYGRTSLLASPDRPHVFVREILLYVENLRQELAKLSDNVLPATRKYWFEYRQNLLEGLTYYRRLAESYVDQQRRAFLDEVSALESAIESISIGDPETWDTRVMASDLAESN